MLEKKKVVGLIIVGIMFFSSITVAFFQASFFSSPQTELPKTNIVDYELTQFQEEIILRNGGTIMKYLYNQTCLECPNEIALLEAFATQFSNQVILEKIQTKENPTFLNIVSALNYTSVKNITEENVFSALCDVLVLPPAACVRIE